MPIPFLDAVEFSKIASLQFVVPVVAADPPGYEAGLIYNSTDKVVKYHNGTAWVPLLTPASGDGFYVKKAGDTMTGDLVIAANQKLRSDTFQATSAATDIYFANDIDMGTKRIHNVLDPGLPKDAVTKQYCDLTGQGFSFKSAVRVVATTNITQSGLTAIDGVTPIANDRILCAGQSTASQNGIWVAASGAWTRATDADASGEIKDGTLVPVAEGTANADSQWLCTSIGSAPWVPGTNASTWTKQSSLTDLVAGGGLTKTGTTIDVGAGTGITVGTDTVALDTTYTNGLYIKKAGDTGIGTLTLLPASRLQTDQIEAASVATDIGFLDNVDMLNFKIKNLGAPGLNSDAATKLYVDNLAPKRFAIDIPAGTSYVATHNLNTRDLQVSVQRTTTPWDKIQCGVEMTSVNTVTLRFSASVAASAYRVVITG